MTRPSHTADRATPPPLAELFAEYLKGQTAAQAVGLGFAEPDGEVEPYESVPVQPVDPALAWTDALAAAGHFQTAKTNWTTPPDWPALVAAQEPAVALTFSLGNFPQMVRNLHPLLAGGDLTALRAGPARGAPAPALVEWARTEAGYPQMLLAAGVLRLARPVRRGRRSAEGASRPRNGRPPTPTKRRPWPGIAAAPTKPPPCGESSPKACRSCSTAAWPPCSWATP